MKRKIISWLGILIILLTSIVMFASPVLAILTYSRDFIFNNTSIIGLTATPLAITTNNTLLINNNYMRSDGLDSRVLVGSTSLPHMLADNSTLFVADVPVGANTYTFETNQSTLSSFPTIVGQNGYVTTNDSATLEPSANFTNNITGYFNTSLAYIGTNIAYKQGAYRVYVQAENNVRAAVLNADDSENTTVDVTVTTGYHVLSISDNTTLLSVSVDLDPIIYGVDSTLTTTAAIQYAKQHKVVYASGLYWVFYYDGSNIVYKTSYDNFLNKTTLEATNSGDNFTMYYDNTYFYYSLRTSSALYFRRGVLTSGAAIIWSAAEQTVLTGVSFYAGTPEHFLTVDSNGHPWILYRIQDAQGSIMITTSTTTDGTWSTKSGYPQTLHSSFSYDMYGLVSLGGGMLYAGYDDNGFRSGAFYNGTTWSDGDGYGGSFENTGQQYTMVSIGNNVYMARNYGGNIGTFKRTYGVGWTYALAANTTYAGSYSWPVMSVLSGSPSLVMYWIYNNSIYMTTSTDGTTWTTPRIVQTESSFITIFTPCISASESGGYVAYLANSIIPYNLKLLRFTSYGSPASTAFTGSVPNSANNWVWMNDMPYTDNLTLSVNGTLKLWYAPNNIISGTTLPDRSGVGNTGTITWGTFPLTAVSLGVLTLAATSVDVTSAQLNGALTDIDSFSSMSLQFQWGETTAYGHSTAVQTVNTTVLFSANISGLLYSNTYHFRAVAYASGVTIYGSDVTFTTLGAPGSSTTLRVNSDANVFSNYLVTNDLLFTAEIINKYPPYYPSQSPKEFFTIQLLDTDNFTILAATPEYNWGDVPVSLYLNPTQAAGITYGGAYYIRLQGNFSSNVSAEYQLQPTDWKGYDLTYLDNWCLATAFNMETYNGAINYITVLTDGNMAITDAVGGYFTTGIPAISQVRPNLFTTSQQNPTFTEGTNTNTWDNATAWSTNVGPNIAADVGVLGTPFGMSGRDMLAGIVALVMLGIVAVGTATMGGFGALGLFMISVPILWLGTYFKIIGVQWIMILTIFMGWWAVRQFIIKTT